MFGELSLMRPSESREHKILAPSFSGYELRACRGMFGIFVPCWERNHFAGSIFEKERADDGVINVCCWPETQIDFTSCQQRRGTYSLIVRGQGIYLHHAIEAFMLSERTPWAEWDDEYHCCDVFCLDADSRKRTEAADVSQSCASVFTFSLDIRAPMGTLWELSVHQAELGQAVVARKEFRASGFWQRDGINVQFMANEPGDYLLSVRRHQACPRQDDFCWYVDGIGLAKGVHNSKFVSGLEDVWFQADQGLRWLGDPFTFSAERDWWTHQGGELVYLKESGFRVTAHRGLGEAPRQHVTSPFAMRPGTHHQRQRFRHREFQLRGQFTTGDMVELHQRRQLLAMLNQKFFTDDESPIRMRYQMITEDGFPIGREMLIDCRCVSGMGGRIASDYGEELELVFVADSPYVFEEREVQVRKRITNASVEEDPEWGQHLFIVNEGDAPSPFYVYVSGVGRFVALENQTSNQRVDMRWDLPGNGYLILAPQETNHSCKAFWIDWATGDKTDLLEFVRPGGHLPILELTPTLLCRKGFNDICLLFDTGEDAPPLDVDVRVVSRNAFYGVDGASIMDLNMIEACGLEQWAV